MSCGHYGDPNFTGEVLGGIRDEVLDQWQEENPHYRREDLDFIFDYVLMGSTRLILILLLDNRGLSACQFSRRIGGLGPSAPLALAGF